MGEIAEDMIQGRACQLCGCYFVDENDDLYEHGYAVTCKSCYRELSEEEKENHERAKKDTA